MNTRKPVIRSPLDRLPLHHKQQITAWLTTGGKDGVGYSYDDVVVMLQKEFGVKTSNTGLHNFYQRNRRPMRTDVRENYDPASKARTIVITIHLPR